MKVDRTISLLETLGVKAGDQRDTLKLEEAPERDKVLAVLPSLPHIHMLEIYEIFIYIFVGIYIYSRNFT